MIWELHISYGSGYVSIQIQVLQEEGGGGLVSQVQDVYSCVIASDIILYSWNKKKSTGYVYDITQHHIHCRRNQQDERVKMEHLSNKSSTI